MNRKNIPIPSHISEAAQAVLKMPINDAQIKLETVEDWENFTNSIHQMYKPMLDNMIQATGVQITKTVMAGIDIYEVLPKETEEVVPDKVLMYLHGGGYTLMYGDLSVFEAVQFIAQSHYRGIVVDYRYPPKHPYPAAINDCISVYTELLRSYNPQNIIFSGASAGGGLSVATALALRERDMPMPGVVIAHTPWSDLTKTGDSYFTNEYLDPLLPSYAGLEPSALAYANGKDLSLPLLSPVNADYTKGFPPTFITSGTRDLFLSNAVRLHRKMRKEGVEAELHIGEGCGHGLMQLPDGLEINVDVIKFIEKHTV